MSSRIAALQRLQRGISTVELVHTPHELWPYPPPSTNCCAARNSLRIAVLDSSFNPPTLAHLALANSALPQFSNSNTFAEPSPCSVHECNYDARLLLLSVRNADKSLKPGDATHLQRLDMMSLLNRDIVLHDEQGSPASPDSDANVAIAIIDEPTFVWKSATLLTFLRQRFADLSSSSPRSLPTPQLVFLQGFDTLERLLCTRYYSSEEAMLQSLRQFFSPHGDNSRVVYARRVQRPPSPHRVPGDAGSQVTLDLDRSEREKRVLEKAREFVAAERIILVDIGEDEQTFSSSEVRDKISRGNESWRKMTTSHIANYIMEQKLYKS